MTTSSADFDNQTRDYWYKARARNCKSSTRTVCSGWSWSNAVRVPPVSTTTVPTPAAPTNLSISVEPNDDNDLDVTFTRSGSIHFYQIELHRSSTQDGAYSRVISANVTTSPVDFDNQTREYWYKARGKNCSTSARTTCSGWSWSNAVRVPPVSTTTPPPTVTPTTPDPPTSLGVTRDANSVLTVSVAYTQSSGSIHYYQIELHSAATENGTYSLQATANDSTTSPAVFQYQPTGSWFKARGRNCTTAERTDCGTWSDWSPAIPPPPHILIYQLASSIEPRQSVPVSGWAFNLDPSSSYSIRITTDNGDIGFNSDCTDDQEDIPVPAGSSYYNFNVVPSLYACDAPAGMITATLLSGGATVYTYEELIIGPVSVQVDNAFPKSSEVADDDSNVTMTAVTNVADTVTLSYQWQQETSDVWSNVGALTASPQKTVTSTSRGTSTYRVVVRHSSGASAETPATYVTWDESEIVVDMLSAMNTAVTGSTEFGTEQTALLNCIERRTGTTHASFDAVLAEYTAATKTAVDACEEDGAPASSDAQLPLTATEMFDTYQRLSIAELTDLRAENSEYDDLLDTDLGREFVENVSSPIIVKRYAGYIATQSSSTARTSALGFGCVPSKAPTSLNSKLNVLTCLIIRTPHNFWAGKTFMVDNALVLKSRIDNPTVWPQYEFLGYGDFDDCTASPDGPRHACRKHDVAYGSLQKFQGVEEGNELDEAWNPRNKSFADLKFYLDVERFGCQNPSWEAIILVCGMPRQNLANFYYWGVTKNVAGHRAWPVTSQDFEHIGNNWRFTHCTNPQLPQVSDLALTGSGNSFTASWNFEPGCVVGLANVDFVLTTFMGAASTFITVDPSAVSPPCTMTEQQNQVVCSHSITLSNYAHYVLVTIVPKQREYGAWRFPSTIGRPR